MHPQSAKPHQQVILPQDNSVTDEIETALIYCVHAMCASQVAKSCLNKTRQEEFAWGKREIWHGAGTYVRGRCVGAAQANDA